MPGISDFITTINGWTKFETDAPTVTSWVRMFEERANEELRHKDMIKRVTTTTYDSTMELPSDWIEASYVRYANGKPLRFTTKDEFFQQVEGDSDADIYTIIGNSLLVNPAVDPTDGKAFEIAYYARLTPLTDVDTPFFTKHPRLYTFGTLAASAAYLEEDERIPVWEGEATRLINFMNESSKQSQYSGSPLVKRIRSFG